MKLDSMQLAPAPPPLPAGALSFLDDVTELARIQLTAPPKTNDLISEGTTGDGSGAASCSSPTPITTSAGNVLGKAGRPAALDKSLKYPMYKGRTIVWPPSGSKHDHLKYLLSQWFIKTQAPDARLDYRVDISLLGDYQLVEFVM